MKTSLAAAVLGLALSFCAPVLAQVAIPKVQAPDLSFANEDKDWGVAPRTRIQGPLHAPTPASLPGGRVIRTMDLKALREQSPNVVVIDVLPAKARMTVPGAQWLVGVGEAEKFYPAEMGRFAAALEKLTGGDKARPLVFLCLSSECWLSYNAALRAIESGFKDVLWYRGGTDAWKGASQDMKAPTSVSW